VLHYVQKWIYKTKGHRTPWNWGNE